MKKRRERCKTEGKDVNLEGKMKTGQEDVNPEGKV
jgi:hypothetical protein